MGGTLSLGARAREVVTIVITIAVVLPDLSHAPSMAVSLLP